jgi:D-alanine-D-alanine ligase
MKSLLPIPHRMLRPRHTAATRILFLARHAPIAPDYICQVFPDDGGYSAYYHRVWQVLTELGFPVTTADDCNALLGSPGRIDLVFSLYNRMPINNPEIFVSSLCEFLRLPSIGARPNTRALAEDKWFSKLAARAIGIPVAQGAIYASTKDLVAPPPFSGPYFIKNRFGAASEGVTAESLQDDWAGASRVAQGLMARGMAVLVEQYAPGVDITVPVLGGEPPMMLGVVRPRSDRACGIITEDLKRDDPLGYELLQPDETLRKTLKADVAALWAASGPIDYLRLDYRFNPATGQRLFLEFNICCHIGRSGAICLAANQLGLNQADVLCHVVAYSLQRQAVNQEIPQWA